MAEAHAFAAERGLPLFVLGGGSNLLVSDAGFHGLVLHIALRGIEQQGSSTIVGAGESWEALVAFAVGRNLQGIECLAGIPGTVGGTPVQNVGAYGQEVAETIHSVRCFDTHTRDFLTLRNAECGFAYRTSIFNSTERGRYIVTEVRFDLLPGGAPKLAYADLQRWFAAKPQPTLADTAEAVRSIRRQKSMVIDPGDPNARSAGSFFRNPVVPVPMLVRVAEAANVPQESVPHWAAGEGCIKLPAAWLLERAGFVRGYELGRAGISSRHTLALINRGGAMAADIVALRDHIIATVQQRFGITLEQEPVSLG